MTHEPADPARFLDVCGRRMALIGREGGPFELWMWPVRIARGLALEARPAAMANAEPARLVSIAREPGAAGLRYEHAAFTVLVRIVAAVDERALVFVFEHLAGAAADVRLRWQPDLCPQWPAGLGGRIAARDEETGALLVTEELGRFAAFAGGPAFAPVGARGDHALGETPVELTLKLDVDSNAAQIVFAGAQLDPGPLSEAARLGAPGAATGFARAQAVVDEARAAWRDAVERAQVLDRERREHWEARQRGWARLRCSDPRVERAFRDAQRAIATAEVEVDGLGRGLVAGIGPSGGGERPGFAWFFDGDALIAARAMALAGDHELLRDALRFAASHQRADGKLMHELVLSAGLCDWLEDYPYAYYKADNSPRFASCLARYVEVSGDQELAHELLPAAVRALDWCESCLDEDGRLANDRAGLGAVEAGPLCGRIRAESFLNGLWLDSLRSLERLAKTLPMRPRRRVGDPAGAPPDHLAEFAELKAEAEAKEGRVSLIWRCEDLRERATEGFEALWSEERDRYAFALLTDGARAADLSAYLARPLMSGFGDPERALATARQLNLPTLTADWGARMFAEDADVYDPAHYNTGSVFPYLTRQVALALYEQGLPTAGFQVLSALAALSGLESLGVIPEHLRGDRAVTPERGVPHQIFSSSALLEGLLRGPLGFRPDALHGRIELAPALPAEWDALGLEQLRVGAARLDFLVTRGRVGDRTLLHLELTRRGGPRLRVALLPYLPPLSELAAEPDTEVSLDTHRSGARRARVEELWLKDRIELTLELRFGPELVLPEPALAPGAPSRLPRLTDHRVDGRRVTFELWGRRGETQRIECRCDYGWRVTRGAARDGDALVIAFQDDGAADFARVEVELEVDEA